MIHSYCVTFSLSYFCLYNREPMLMSSKKKCFYLNCPNTGTYCEIIINRGVLIFADFMVHFNHENKSSTKYNFSVDCC